MTFFSSKWSHFLGFIYKVDGGKNVINFYNIGILVIGLFISFFAYVLFKKEDTSFLIHGTKQAMRTKKKEQQHEQTKNKNYSFNSTVWTPENSERNNSKKSQNYRQTAPPIKYKAIQIIGRDRPVDGSNFIPIGTNFIGQLLTGIDSREQSSIVKVILPYGGSYKGRGKIPKNSTLLGIASYKGQGEKICIKFDRGVTPEGIEFKIEAHALDTRDYSPCIIGDYHSSAGIRVATTLGLTMVSGMSDVLTKKVAIGNTGPLGGPQTVTPDATMRNALLHGTSKVADMEAQRQAQRMNQEGQEYVTLDSGKDLIVSLTQTFIPTFQ